MIKGMCWFICTGVYVHPGETAGAAEINKWGIANMQACGLIYNSVSPSIQPFVQELMDSAKGMWDALAAKFEQQNSTARFITVNNLLSVQKQPDELLSSLIGRVDSYLQALRASHPKEFTLEGLEAELAAMALMRALPDEFSNFKSSFLLVNSDGGVKYDKVKQAFLQEEQARAAAATDAAFRASTSTRGRGRGGRGTRGRGRGGKAFTPCTHPSCKSQNSHSLDNCFTKMREENADLKKKVDSARSAEASIEEVADFAGSVSDFDFSDPHSPLLNDAAANWVADTGATRHMTPHRH